MTIIFVILFFVNSVICTSMRNIPRYNTTMEYIQMAGYPAESHYVQTSDGYILNMQRIPRCKNGKTNNKVVYLQHGFVSSSSSFVLSGPGKSLAYILSDEGFDVWLGNNRGNVFSRNHTSMNPETNKAFWDFSWHEMGVYDLPACIDYILDKTKKKSLYYGGHSQGTTIFYVLNTMKPEYNKKIQAFFHMGPAVYVSHIKSPLFRLVATFVDTIQAVSNILGTVEISTSNGILSKLLAVLCSAGEIGSRICENLFGFLYGPSPTEMNSTLTPKIGVEFPCGSSMKQLIHIGQIVQSGRFRQFDYKLENIVRYGRPNPPEYDLSKVTTPGILLYGPNDWLIDAVIDVPRLYNALTNAKMTKYLVPIPSFNHMDFHFGIHAPSVVFPKIIEFLKQH